MSHPDVYDSRETFHKTERLCSRKTIAKLFEKGNSFYSSEYKVVWIINLAPLSSPAQVAFSVSKRNFRLAVTRNLLKRRMREAYRKNKHLLYAFLMENNIQIVFFIIYRESHAEDYATIEKSMKEALRKLTDKIKLNMDKC